MYKTFKKFTATLFAGAVLLATPFAANAAVVLSLQPVANKVEVGSAVTVNLVVSGLGNHSTPSVSAFDVDINYDASLFSLSAFTYGPSLGSLALGEAFTTLSSSAGAISASELSLLETSSTACSFCTGPYLEGLQGSTLTLASLTFTSLHDGTGTFNLVANAFADGFGDALTIDQVTGANVAVPAPAALWLFGTGLAALGIARGRARS